MVKLKHIAFILLLITACSQHKVILSEQEYLDLGKKCMAERDYVPARKAFEDLEAKYPDSPHLAEARLTAAQSYFDQGKYDEAALQYQRFMRFHPRNPLADKAQFQLALSYFSVRMSIDRDPDYTKKALQAFELLLYDYESSPFRKEAEEKRATCLEELAEHEFYIGHFYFQQKKYEAASERLRKTVLDYPKTKVAANALYYLAESYWQLGKCYEAQQLFKLYLEKYADQEYASQAKKRMEWQDS